MISEFKLIEQIKRKIPRRLQGSLGIGDDTGTFSGRRGDVWLFTSDCIVENVDFIRKSAKPEFVGRKALAINLSDLAAMGGKPVAFTVTLGIPPDMNEKWIQRFYSGLIKLAREYKTLCVGGDITRAKEFFVSIALIGRPHRKIVTRSGAKAGDLIAVTGHLGGSILHRHFLFAPRLKEAEFLVKKFKPSAMIDISDGFAQDLGHILKASRGGANLDLKKIPISKDAKRLAQGDSRKALQHALSDGEDFELIFTLPARQKEDLVRQWKRNFPKVPLSWVGKIVRGKSITPKIYKKGYTHFG